MKVRLLNDEVSDNTSPDVARVGPEVCQEVTATQGWEAQLFLSFIPLLYYFPPQFVEEALSKNNTVLQFHSPVVNGSCNIQALQTFLHLDNVVEELKGFDYHPDPSFNELLKNVITETSIIIVTVRGHALTLTARRIRFSDLTLGFCSGSRFRQGHDSQGGPGVCWRRHLSREHPAGVFTSVTSAARPSLSSAERLSPLCLFRRTS